MFFAAFSISKQMAMRAYRNERLGCALAWCIRAKVGTVFFERSY